MPEGLIGDQKVVKASRGRFLGGEGAREAGRQAGRRVKEGRRGTERGKTRRRGVDKYLGLNRYITLSSTLTAN